MSAATRVLSVDDQTLVRSGFRLILEGQADMDVVGQHADGAAAASQVRLSFQTWF